MTNESTPECLNHKDNRNVQVRLDYMLLYRSEAKAKIIRVLETWTNRKYAEWSKATADTKEQESDPPEEDLWVTMSYEQLSIFVYGTAQHDTIKQNVDELITIAHIQRRPHPEIPYGPPQYLLKRNAVQDALDALEIPLNLFDLSPLFISPRKKQTPLDKYPLGGGKKPTREVGKIPPGWGENTHPSNNYTKKHLETTKKEENEGVTAPFVASPPSSSSFASENESHSQQEPTLPIASRHYETSTTTDVTQAFQESEIVHGHASPTPPRLPGDDQRGTAGTQRPLSAGPDISMEMGREALGGRVYGYEKGVRDEPGTDGIWDRDAGDAGRDTALPAPPDQHFARDPQEQAIQEAQTAQEVTQQTPLSQGLAPALDGDTSESNVTPPVAFPRLSHTPFYEGLDIFAEDTWVVLPGRATETTRASADTSLATTQTTNDAVRESTTTPASLDKTVQTRKNKKVPEGPPAFPASDAPWNAEAAVEIVEAKKGRRYGETTRAQELAEAKKVLKMDFSGGTITRKQFEDAWDDMAGWAFWKEHTNVKPMIRTLRKDDKIIAILEELNQKKTKSSGGGNGSPPSSSGGGSTHRIRPTISGKRRLDIDDTPPLAAARTSARSHAWA